MSVAALSAEEVVETLEEGFEFTPVFFAALLHFVHSLFVLPQPGRAPAGQAPNEAFRGLVGLAKLLHPGLELSLLFKNEFHGLLDVHSGSLLVVRYCCAEQTITAMERAGECGVLPPVCEGGLVIYLTLSCLIAA
jgi:hypothetical protein